MNHHKLLFGISFCAVTLASCTPNPACHENSCPDGMICSETGDCVPAPDPCSACSENQKCVDNVCTDLCGNSICTDSEICLNNACYKKCASKEDCNNDEECSDDGRCVMTAIIIGCPERCGEKQECNYDTHQCEDIKCGEAVCSDTEKCVNNVCKPLCGETVCDDSQKCVEDVCKPLCGDIVCEASQRCSDDVCKPLCGDNVCEDSQKCIDDACKPLCGEIVCQDDQRCVDDICKPLCGEEVCQDDQRCVNDTCKSLCGEVICLDSQQCVDNICKDLCGNQVCADNQICDHETSQCITPADPCDPCTQGKLKDVYECIDHACVPSLACSPTQSCPDNFRCDSTIHKCVAIDPCQNVICPSGKTCLKMQCIDNDCLDNGKEKVCDDGYACHNGVCEFDCKDITCNEGLQCIKGICTDPSCLNVFCDTGKACSKGKCTDLACIDMACPEGTICRNGSCTYEICLDKPDCPRGSVCDAEGQCQFAIPPALILTHPQDKVTDEDGKTIEFTVVLNSAPAQDVTLKCEFITESPNPEADAPSCDEILFTPETWNNPQTIFVSGEDDQVVDGNQIYQLKVTTVSNDSSYNELTATSEELTNIDTTVPGVFVSNDYLQTHENGSDSLFLVGLSTKPTHDVTLTIKSSDETEGRVGMDSIVFSKDGLVQYFIVMVQAVDDDEKDGNITYQITFQTQSEDPNYNGLTISPITVLNVDDDSVGYYSGTPSGFSIREGEIQKLSVYSNTGDNFSFSTYYSNGLDFTKLYNNENKFIFLVGSVDNTIDGDNDAAYEIEITNASNPEILSLPKGTFTGTVIDVDKADIRYTLSQPPAFKENDDIMTVSLSLASKPTGNVTITPSVSDDTEISLRTENAIEFTPSNWNTKQEIIIAPITDDIADGNVRSSLILTCSSPSDTNYNTLIKQIDITTVDIDKAGLNISKPKQSIFRENDHDEINLAVSLLSKPSSNVTVTLSSSDATELAILSDKTLTFTPDDYNTPQIIQTAIIDDVIADGLQTAYINFYTNSEDSQYNKVTAQSEPLQILDNEMLSLAMTPDRPTITGPFMDNSAQVYLGMKPDSDVTVNFTSASGNLTFDPPKLTISPDHWNEPMTVNIWASSDYYPAAYYLETISAKISDTAHSNPSTLAIITAPEVQDFTFTGDVKLVTLPRGKYLFEVWGAQGGAGGGHGGYSRGVITLENKTKAYVYVGGEGSSADSTTGTSYNGGGAPTPQSLAGGGGGATDIRLGTDNLFSRIIVAGGGGGAYVGCTGGVGGGSSSSQGTPFLDMRGTPATLVSPGLSIAGSTDSFWEQLFTNGNFGIGGEWNSEFSNLYFTRQKAGFPSGGGGWYGGGAGAPAAGGSGWVYTQANYDYWFEKNTIDAQRYNKNMPKLSSAQMIPGDALMPAPNGGTEIGHAGNGYARITLLK